MNWQLLSNLLLGIFLFAPGAFLLIRFLRGRRFPWWLVIGLSLVIGWAGIVGVSWSHTENLTAQMHEYEARGESVPDDLMEAWASDASAVFALWFGWAFTLPILCLWLMVYACAHGIRLVIRKRKL